MPDRKEFLLISDELHGYVIAVIRPEGPGRSSFGTEIALVINLVNFGLLAWDG